MACSSKSPPASPKALCGPYSWPADSGSGGTNTYVGSDGWNNQPGETYDLQVVNPGNWTDTVTAAPCQCVSAYPSVEQYGPNNPLKVSAYTKITSTYAEAMNANSASVTHAAYDIWTGSSSNLFADETMIMNDRTASDPGCDSAILASPTFTEPSTGRQVAYDFCQSGSERQFIGTATSGKDRSTSSPCSSGWKPTATCPPPTCSVRSTTAGRCCPPAAGPNRSICRASRSWSCRPRKKLPTTGAKGCSSSSSSPAPPNDCRADAGLGPRPVGDAVEDHVTLPRLDH